MMGGTTAVVVRHYPGRGRLSGLVSFAHQFLHACAGRGPVTVFSGDPNAGALPSGLRHVAVGRPFWLRVWWHLRRHKPTRLIILSGIHEPRWLWAMALLMRLAPPRAACRLYVQSVTLDHAPSARLLRLLERAARIAVMNPAENARLRAAGVDTTWLPPGLDLQAVEHGPRMPRSSGFRIGFLGHFNQVKGADRIPGILDRLADLPDWDAVICGSGALAPMLKDWAAPRDNIKVLDYLDDPLSILRSCDVLLAPFTTSASVLGISQVVLEALALGVPVVGSRVEAVSEAVTHGREGLLGEDDEEMSGHLVRLMADRALREEMERMARDRAGAFDIESVVSAALATFPGGETT